MPIVHERPPIALPAAPREEWRRPPARRLTRRLAVTGSVWTVISQVALNVLRLASSLILTRLLTPDAFGLTAITGVIMVGLQMLSDIGISPAIVRDERGDDPKFLNTAWTIQVGRGVLLWAITCLIAWPIAMLYGRPILITLVPVVGLTTVLAGLSSTSLHTAQRHLQLGRLAIIEIVGQFVGLIVMVIIALASPTVWALVLGGLVGTAVRTILSHVIFPEPRNRFAWDPDSASALLHFGKWITLNSSLYYLASNLDRLMLGRIVTMANLGIYQTAMTLAQPAHMLNVQLARAVMLPMFSQANRDDPQTLRDVYYRGRLYSDLLLLPVVGMLSALATPVVGLLYDSRYALAGPMLQLLLLNTALKCMIAPADSCLTARGFVSHLTIMHVVRTVWMLIGIPLGWHLGGLMGVVWAVATVEIPVLLLYWRALHRHHLLSIRRELLGPLLTLAGFGLGALCGVVLQRSFPS